VGDVLTIEPGLYYPEREIGVRVEDTYYIAEDGRPVSFCSLSRGLGA
jgi:Xaa-Pro aminopeptidase